MGRGGKLRGKLLTLLLLLLPCVVSGGGYFGRQAGASVAQKKKKESSGKQLPPPPLLLARARVLYANNCALCHGADGRGQTAMGRAFAAPNLADAGWWKKTRPADKRLSNSIRRGRGRMPAFGQRLSKSDIAALVSFVRAFDGR